ncbi:putative short chain dehydrogenase [Mycobacterium kansasii]|uniref:Putative short chain dehydrogenase n=1 Tax=Mycobacterium kansasii TaxID=1768 RepID=A0A1V3WXP2_MYCKA|nr:putative short chain dehydrogenase [Mycobacterium kansasii]
MAAYAPLQSLSAYCTSKAATYMFSDCLRAELDAAGVGLTTVCPGVIDTNIIAATRFDTPFGKGEEQVEGRRSQLDKMFALRHYGPDKVAHAIVSAVKKNKPIRPVAPEAYALYGISRCCPRRCAVPPACGLSDVSHAGICGLRPPYQQRAAYPDDPDHHQRDGPHAPARYRRFTLRHEVGVWDDLVEDRDVGAVAVVGVSRRGQVGGEPVSAGNRTTVAVGHRHRHQQADDTGHQQHGTHRNDQPSQSHNSAFLEVSGR